MNKRKLKAAMVLKGDTNNDLANYLGIAPTTLSVKINSKAEFSQTEIGYIIKRYSLTPDDVLEIFFS